MPISRTLVELGEILRRVIDEVQTSNPGSMVLLELSEKLPGRWDRQRLEQLASNLLNNAIQHGTGKHIIVKAGRDESEVFFEVTNEGPPIPDNLLAAIFDPLVQVRRSDPGASGLGLGLFIAKEIAIAHGGTISVTSSERDGTTFLVSLPHNSADE